MIDRAGMKIVGPERGMMILGSQEWNEYTSGCTCDLSSGGNRVVLPWIGLHGQNVSGNPVGLLETNSETVMALVQETMDTIMAAQWGTHSVTMTGEFDCTTAKAMVLFSDILRGAAQSGGASWAPEISAAGADAMIPGTSEIDGGLTNNMWLRQQLVGALHDKYFAVDQAQVVIPEPIYTPPALPSCGFSRVAVSTPDGGWTLVDASQVSAKKTSPVVLMGGLGLGGLLAFWLFKKIAL